MSGTYSIASLHPDRLRCETCGETVGMIGDAGPAEPLGSLTADQAVREWPELANAIREHDVLCTWRRNPPVDGLGVYVHATPRQE
jgi:hypothetical protein